MLLQHIDYLSKNNMYYLLLELFCVSIKIEKNRI